MLFAALATVIGFSICCPTGQCTELPNIDSYLSHRGPLQAKVNISTTTAHDLTFRPNFFEDLISQEHIRTYQSTPEVNGCEAMYNFTSQSVGVESPCPWRYLCDYNPQRIPAFIFHAHCDDVIPQGREWINREDRICKEVYYPVSFITTTSCDPLENTESTVWRHATTTIPVSCDLQHVTYWTHLAIFSWHFNLFK